MDYTGLWIKLETLRGRPLLIVIKHGALLSGIFGLSASLGLSIPLLIVGLSIIEAALYRPRCKHRYTRDSLYCHDDYFDFRPQICCTSNFSFFDYVISSFLESYNVLVNNCWIFWIVSGIGRFTDFLEVTKFIGNLRILSIIAFREKSLQFVGFFDIMIELWRLLGVFVYFVSVFQSKSHLKKGTCLRSCVIVIITFSGATFVHPVENVRNRRNHPLPSAQPALGHFVNGRENGIRVNSRSFAGDVAGGTIPVRSVKMHIRTRVFRWCIMRRSRDAWSTREFAAATVAVCIRENCGPLPPDLCNRITPCFQSSFAPIIAARCEPIQFHFTLLIGSLESLLANHTSATKFKSPRTISLF